MALFRVGKMADLEARREARRRKIIQNSENRLNRLLGKPVSSDEAEAGTDSISTSSIDVSDQDPLPERRDLSPGRTATTDRPVPSLVEEIRLGTAGDTSPAVSEESQIHSEGVRPRSHRAIPTDREREEKCVPVGSANPIKKKKNGMVDSPARAEPTMPAQVDTLRLLELMRCGGCLLAAFLTRWALSFGLGLLFLECVMIPFVIMEGSLLYFQTTHMKDLQLPHKSSMMSYALMLSGVRQDLIVMYNKIMGYFNAATEDFALFLFTFIVCNAVVT